MGFDWVDRLVKFRVVGWLGVKVGGGGVGVGVGVGRVSWGMLGN